MNLTDAENAVREIAKIWGVEPVEKDWNVLQVSATFIDGTSSLTVHPRRYITDFTVDIGFSGDTYTDEIREKWTNARESLKGKTVKLASGELVDVSTV